MTGIPHLRGDGAPAAVLSGKIKIKIKFLFRICFVLVPVFGVGRLNDDDDADAGLSCSPGHHNECMCNSEGRRCTRV